MTPRCRRQYWSIFIRLAVVGSQICKIPRNTETIRTHISTKTSKVSDLGVNRKRICEPLQFLNETYPAKTRGMGLPYGENRISLTSTVFTARCTLVQSAVLRSHVVCPSVRPSVTLVNCDHIGRNSSKIISPLVSPGRSLFATPT